MIQGSFFLKNYVSKQSKINSDCKAHHNTLCYAIDAIICISFLRSSHSKLFFYEAFYFIALILIFCLTFRFVIYESEYEILHFVDVPIILLVFISLDSRFKGVEMPKALLIRMKHKRLLFFRKGYLYFKNRKNEIVQAEISLRGLSRRKRREIND